MSKFIHLHLHSDFSLLDGVSKIPEIVNKAKEHNMTHIALTDHGNLFGAVKFFKAAKKAGIIPIIGMEAYFSSTKKTDKTTDALGKISYHLLLLVKNEIGYKNLLKLSSVSYLEGFYYKPRIDKDELKKYHEGLICTSACIGGLIPKLILSSKFEAARNEILWFKGIFKGDFYLELQRHGIPEQDIVNNKLMEFSRELEVPLVVTNDSHYVNKNDANAQDIVICIGTGARKNDTNRMKMYSNEFYIKSQDEMCELFSDIPEALENTVKIANKCNDFEMYFPGPILPDYEVPNEFKNRSDYLTYLTFEGLKERYPELTKAIEERVTYELDVIVNMGFEGYFLIVWDFIKFARDSGIPVGPGRGSGSGSIVAYSLKITDIDPLKYNLLFERFLNPERISMPDFDIDFCFVRREEIIQYVIRKYGEDKVAQIITFGTLKPKAVVKDVARVLDISFAQSNELTKMIPEGPKVSLKEALKDASFREHFNKNELYKELIDTALVLEGMNRHASTHAAGIVISKTPLTDYVPLYKDLKQNSISTQYTMDLLEDCGLVKMDFLGLKTLTLIKNTEDLIRIKDFSFRISDIPDYDFKTFELLCEGKSNFIFQFESSGMQQVLKEAKPNSIEDLIALNALYRPGPMQFIPQFIEAKSGKKEIKYPHKDLISVLKPTYGVIVYQEQVMQVAQIIGNFSLAKADILRRAMGKKKEEEMNKMKDEFLKGALVKGYSEKLADDIFELLKPFAGYGFNKSHAASYSILAYQTAYLKANYPEYFMAANLTNEVNNPERLTLCISEANEMSMKILKPDINDSYMEFRVKGHDISYGLGAIKNLGETAVKFIIEEREQNGIYKSFENFLQRVDAKLMNKKILESAIKAGLFDNISENRRTLFENFETVVSFINDERNNKKFGQNDLFYSIQNSKESTKRGFIYERKAEYKHKELLSFEKELLGFYVSGHPLDPYKVAINNFTDLDLEGELANKVGKIVNIVGILSSIKVIQTKKNNLKMAFGVIEDLRGQIEIVVFSDVYEKYKDYLIEGEILGFVGKLTFIRDKFSVAIEKIINVEELNKNKKYSLHIKLLSEKINNTSLLFSLKKQIYSLEDNTGYSNVYLYFKENRREIKLKSNMSVGFKPDKIKLDNLKGHEIIEDIWFD